MINDGNIYYRCVGCGVFVNSSEEQAHGCLPPMAPCWNNVLDENVELIWKRTCKCKGVKRKVILTPDEVPSCGIPICEECGENFKYVRTDIRQ